MKKWIILACVTVGVVWGGMQILSKDIPFDRDGWRDHYGVEIDNPRWYMVHDLQRHHLRPGTPREKVIELLGSSDWPLYGSEPPGTLKYVLGMHSGFGMDVDTMDIFFDEQGFLTRVEFTQH
jgi:hypothetical protein